MRKVTRIERRIRLEFKQSELEELRDLLLILNDLDELRDLTTMKVCADWVNVLNESIA